MYLVEIFILIMLSLEKQLNLKVVLWIIGVFFLLFANTLYSYPLPKETLRIPSVFQDREQRIKNDDSDLKEEVYIYNSEKSPPKVLAEILKNQQESKKDDKKPLAIAIFPKITGEDFFTRPHVIQPVIDLVTHGYRVMYAEKGTVSHVISSIRKYAGLTLLKEQAPFGMSGEELLNATGVAEAVENNGHVILMSCSTGLGKEKYSFTMANMFHRVVPHAHIWAPSEDFSLCKLVFDGNSLINVEFGYKDMYSQKEDILSNMTYHIKPTENKKTKEKGASILILAGHGTFWSITFVSKPLSTYETTLSLDGSNDAEEKKSPTQLIEVCHEHGKESSL